MQLLNTLYVTTPDSYLHLDNDTLRVEVEHDTRLRVPLHHLGAIVCLGNIRLSTPLMHRAADEGIALVMLDSHGRFKARLEGPVSGNVLLRSAQFDRSRDPLFALDVARNMVAGKIRNSRQILLRGARESKDDTEAGQIARAAGIWPLPCARCPRQATSTCCAASRAKPQRQYFAARIAPWQRGRGLKPATLSRMKLLLMRATLAGILAVAAAPVIARVPRVAVDVGPRSRPAGRRAPVDVPSSSSTATSPAISSPR